MKYNSYGQAYTTQDELCELLYKNPKLDLSKFNVEDPLSYNKAVRELYADLPILTQFVHHTGKVEEFDQYQQAQWHMPEKYKQLDIAKWVLEQCSTDAELQRCGHELLLFQARNLLTLLQYLKYLVDTMRTNNIVWGVGRGSSVSSYVLYKIGVHKIDSLYYDLDPAEFLK
jgi:DNA polymerase III alpha subunit